ncbi:MAG: hypothetical protein RhofKO_24790 [Rhodothermales bacterium]
MAAERRYSEEEIAAIFQKAVEAQETTRRQQAPDRGLTLDELKAIGAESGIDAAFIEHAAQAVHVRPAETDQVTYLRVPIGVSHTVDLPGSLSEANWHRVVAECQATFQADGKQRHTRTTREWYNGNLKIIAEPSESGHRLRMRTIKSDAKGLILMSAIFGVMGLVFTLLRFVNGVGTDLPETGIVFFWSGLAMGLVTALQQPGWARKREQQMATLAEKATAWVEADATKALAPQTPSASRSMVEIPEQGEPQPLPSRNGQRSRT